MITRASPAKMPMTIPAIFAPDKWPAEDEEVGDADVAVDLIELAVRAASSG